MERDKLLTISILVSNRKETIEKCLASLKPLLEALDSELIIIDTGCERDTLDIIEKYTDQIYPFTWCNDFSKARNEGLMRARGKWFMYMDDDEWFEDVSEIIDFFKNEEYLKYHSASYLVRNYQDFSGKLWKDSIASRMIELKDNTKFISAIHESFNDIYGPMKEFSAYAHHYGYVYKSTEEKRKHDQRNLQILELEYNNNHDNIRIVAHLAQEYLNIKNYEGIERLYKELEVETLKGINNIGYGNVTCVYYIESLRKQKKYEHQLMIIEQFENKKVLNSMARAKMCAIGIEACYFQKKYIRGIKYLEEYERTKKEFEENSKNFINQRGLILDSTFAKSNHELALGYGILCALANGEIETAKSILSKIDWEAEQLHIPGEYVSELISIIKRDCKENDYQIFFNKLICRTGMEEILTKFLVKHYFDATENEKKNIINHLCSIKSKKAEIAILCILQAIDKELDINWQEKFEVVWANAPSVLLIMEQWKLWEIFFEKHINFEALLKYVNFSSWCNSVNQWYKTAPNSTVIQLNELFDMLQEDNYYRLYWKSKLQEARLLTKYLDLSFSDFAKELKAWCDSILNVYHRLYQITVFEQLYCILPTECKFAIMVSEILDDLENYNYKRITETLKEKSIKYENLNSVWLKFLNELKILIKGKSKFEEEKQQEILKKGIINKIYYFIDIEDYEQAEKILIELMQYYDNDSKLEELKEEIVHKLKNCN